MIYTFYSFKGGVGRSMAAANVAKWFYLQGLRVVMVDWDLEAPGLENFFFAPSQHLTVETDTGNYASRQGQPSKGIDDVHSQLGVVDLIENYRQRFPTLQTFPETEDRVACLALLNTSLPSIPGFLYRVEPQEFNESKRLGAGLWLLPAGLRAQDHFTSYSQLVQSFDWADFYTSYQGFYYFEWIREQLTSFADVVIIDSRTGVTEMGGVCTRQLADVVVCFSAPNFQNLHGLAVFLSSLKNSDLK